VFLEIQRGALVRRFGNGQTVICLHGFADNGSMFEPLAVTTAAERLSFAAVDLPGFGVSPRQDGLALIDDYARWLNELVRSIELFGRVGLLAHSVASMIAVRAIRFEPDLYSGLFSIEGNLTEADTYFSGQASEFEEPMAFKEAFLERVWQSAGDDPMVRRYHAVATLCDAEAMWRLGRDAKAQSANDAPGEELLSLPIPLLYYWSAANTPAKTRDFISSKPLSNHEFSGASHCPTIDAPKATGEMISGFFKQLSSDDELGNDIAIKPATNTAK
jgi:pimeloyl-ACP methyl ester carboxylesterase